MDVGPLGPQFNTLGNTETQVYLPLYNPDYPSVYPPVQNDIFTPRSFTQQFLAGLPVSSSVINSIIPDEVVMRFIGYSIAEIERSLGVFIQRRQVIANAGMRGFRYGSTWSLYMVTCIEQSVNSGNPKRRRMGILSQAILG